jgi:hypothetical protein
MKGILEKKQEGWFVKWSDLHSFTYGTHWVFTKLSSDSNSIKYLEDNMVKYKPLEEGIEVEFKFEYHEVGLLINCAKLIFPEVDEFENEGVNEGLNEGVKKLSFSERCRIANYTPFNIENLIGELSKMKKEPYLTQEEFEQFHHTIMDGLNIPRQMLEKLLKYEK